MWRLPATLLFALWSAAAAAEPAVVIGFDNESANGVWTGASTEDGFTYSRLSGGLWLQAAVSASASGHPVPHMEGLLGSGGGTLSIVRAGGGPFTFDGADVAQVFLKFGASRTVTFQGLSGGRTVGTDSFMAAAATNVWTSHASAGLSGVVLDELRVILDAEGVTTTEAVDNIALTVIEGLADAARGDGAAPAAALSGALTDAPAEGWRGMRKPLNPL